MSETKMYQSGSSVVTTSAVRPPATHAEALAYDKGYRAGLADYARGTGMSTKRSENSLLAELLDAQGWRTLETFEKLSEKDGQ